MQRFKHLRLIVFIVCTVLFLSTYVYKTPLPTTDKIDPRITWQEPKQTEIREDPLSVPIKRFQYRLKPHYEYELYGLVVSARDGDNWLNIHHSEDPGNIRDICVVWGKNIQSGAYKQVKYGSGEFTCSYSWKDAAPPFSPQAFANNHVIPATQPIADRIKEAAVGDQIYIKGFLVDYSVHGEEGELFSRTTSTTREDTGNGACEIIFVEDFKIINRANHLPTNLRFYSAIGVTTSFLLFGILSVIL